MDVTKIGDGGGLSDLQDANETTGTDANESEAEAVESRRGELGQIQQDLRILMDRLNEFIAGSSTSSCNTEELNSLIGTNSECTKNKFNDSENANKEALTEILTTEIERHLRDMREIQNLSVLTNMLMAKIRKVTDLTTGKKTDGIKLLKEADEEVNHHDIDSSVQIEKGILENEVNAELYDV